MDRFIDSVVATADAVGARLKNPKRIGVSFDEWNVWYQRRFHADPPTEWRTAPRLIEDAYSVTDAVVVGNLLISLLRHSDRVHVACQAQLVNVIAPIRSEPGGPAWRQTIFHPFALTSRMAQGDVLQVRIDSPTQETGRFGEVPVVDAVATHDAGSTSLFVVNRHRSEPVTLEVPVGSVEVREAWQLCDADSSAVNSAAEPDRVVPREISPVVEDGVLRLTLPPVSWSAVRVSAEA